MSLDDQGWLKPLNERQLEAVTHGDGPLLVVAGAGSGKTRTLAYRVAWLISRGVPPEKILLLTFTRRAAQEMLRRAGAVIPAGSSAAGQVWGGTFHATANRLLRIYAHAAHLSPDFTIIDQSDAEDLMNVVRHELGYSSKESRFPRKTTCLTIYSRRVNGSEPLETVLNRHFPWCARWQEELTALFRSYVERKQRQQILDYDDLLLYWYYLLENKEIAGSIERRFDHVLVDEYQDTNRIQAGILAGMRCTNRNIMAVGDDAQSIYSFRSATVRNMLDFPAQFPGAHVVTLEQNYRSAESILVTTNRVIAQARQRYSKELWSTRKGGQRPLLVTCKDENDQTEQVVGAVLRHYEEGIQLQNQAVLFRAASHSASLELELARRNIPFRKYGGLRFLDAAHIKDLIGFLRIAENPQDQMAWFRILQLLAGIGPVSAAAAFEFVAKSGFIQPSVARFPGPSGTQDELAGLGALFADLRKDIPPPAQIGRIRHFYKPILERTYENAEMRENDLGHLEQLAGGYRSRKKFLEELMLDPPSSTGDFAGPGAQDEDWLVLSTIHSAKGCEWDAVYVIHAADGCLPSDMATGSDEEIEEELRLTYVAMTRARDFLYVLWPIRYYHSRMGFGDGHNYAQCCRFFTDNVKCSMDIIEREPQAGEADEQAAAGPQGDIGAKIRRMWE